MDVILGFAVFTLAIFLCTLFGVSSVWPMLFGLALFSLLAARRGCSWKTIGRAIWRGVAKSPKILLIMLCVGILTATWRMGGVIAFFVYHGVRLISPPLFLLLAFLLSTLVAYALGSTVAVISTVGIIFMTIARSGGVDPLWAAGAILSGSYLAERLSPTSSCQNLISSLCGSDLYSHIHLLQRSSVLPFVLSALFYGAVSLAMPLVRTDASILISTASDFQISFWALVPMALILLLPLLHVDVRWAILLSALSAGVLAVLVQGYSCLQVLRAALLGFQKEQAALGALWNGGGILSVLSIMAVFVLAYTYSTLFEEGDMLSSFRHVVALGMTHLGKTLTLILISVIFSAIFCSGTTAAILAILILSASYEEQGIDREVLAQDIGILLLCITPMIPWCVTNAMVQDLFQVPVTVIFYVIQPPLSVLLYLLQSRLHARSAKKSPVKTTA